MGFYTGIAIQTSRIKRFPLGADRGSRTCWHVLASIWFLPWQSHPHPRAEANAGTQHNRNQPNRQHLHQIRRLGTAPHCPSYIPSCTPESCRKARYFPKMAVEHSATTSIMFWLDGNKIWKSGLFWIRNLKQEYEMQFQVPVIFRVWKGLTYENNSWLVSYSR